MQSAYYKSKCFGNYLSSKRYDPPINLITLMTLYDARDRLS